MRIKSIPSTWLQSDGRRLDCGPYMSGALEAKIILEKLQAKKQQLKDLTSGYNGGIYNGPQFSRTWVDEIEHGVPFVGSSAMLSADLSSLPLLRKRDAESSKLVHLRLSPGMTLITCSGTIGRMVYVRPDMDGIWSSQHIMKVVPNRQQIPPGYLFAFLSSKFGVPLVVGGTYGAIIQHIEPDHIADLPVPRLGREVEESVHLLVDNAASKLAKYRRLLNQATDSVLGLCGLTDVRDSDWLNDRSALGWSQLSVNTESLRAMNFDPRARRIWLALEQSKSDPLGSLCDPAYFKGKIIFKRIDADPEYGSMLVGQKKAFHLRPEGRWISRKSITRLGLHVPAGTTMVPSHGTLGEHELYCRALIVTEGTSKYAFSGDFFRCIPVQEKIRPGYLFAFMRSRTAFRLLRSISAGGKQQEQHPRMMWRFPIPRLAVEEEAEIADLIDEACILFDEALEAEDLARKTVEQAIEGNA